MTEASKGQMILSDKVIWIIDDEIPIDQAPFDHSDMVEGIRPIDLGTLRALVAVEGWRDQAVKALCEQLIREAQNVQAFIQPSAAIEYLKRGALVPDAIIFDLKYRNLSTEQVSEYLRKLLSRCVSVIQVYTQESIEEAQRDLASLLTEYPHRLVTPQNKSHTEAKGLATVLSAQMQTSLSAHLAAKIRRLSSIAVEDVLIKIDDLPLSVAVRLLAGETESPDESELIEFLSVKVSEALGNASEIEEAVRQYVASKGISTDRAKEVAQEIIALLVAHVLEHIRNDGGLFSEIQSAREAARAREKPEGQVEKIIQDFFAFRVYAQPTDHLVRTGDIIAFTPESDSQDPPDLYLVVTPACDLAKFWKKTRGTLTFARMRPLNQKTGLARVQSYGTRFQMGDSITARNPMVMPSVPVTDDKRVDYVLFAHEIVSKDFENPELKNAGERNRQVQSPLIYSELSGAIIRKCRVSEPFLAGILAELASTLFRIGVPDFPDEEKTRLGSMFND